MQGGLALLYSNLVNRAHLPIPMVQLKLAVRLLVTPIRGPACLLASRRRPRPAHAQCPNTSGGLTSYSLSVQPTHYGVDAYILYIHMGMRV